MTGNPDYDHYAGKHAQLPVTDTMTMHVVIVDVRRAYGRTDVQVAPAVNKAGNGATWIDVRKLRLEE